MNQFTLQPTVDFNQHWHLPAYYYFPLNRPIFRISVFCDTPFEMVETTIREGLQDRPSPPESVLVRAEAGVDLEVLQQCQGLFSELLPGVSVCFESGFTKDMLYQYLYYARKMKEFYKALAN